MTIYQTPDENQLLDPETRSRLWTRLIETIENYTNHIAELRATPELEPQKIRSLLAACTFEQPMDPLEAVDFVARGLSRYQTHSSHPRYFGLYNPAPTTMGIAAEALVAAFNPQLASWSHSPLAIEIEQHLIRCFGEWFGYDPKQTDGTFTSGGAEANHTALAHRPGRRFPRLPDARRPRARRPARLLCLGREPSFFLEGRAHHGIGIDALKRVEIDDELRMRPEALQAAIARDRGAGCIPFMVVATAGTTNAGVVDPLPQLAAIAARHRLWFHVDAAWGGAAALVPELRPLLDGIASADSITFDPHKWLNVPMGAGVYLTRHMEILHRTFRTQTAYMPREALGLDVIDPHLHTMQWSRRFNGLKVFLSLLVAGRAGYAHTIRRQTALGNLLRDELRKSGWAIENSTPLPVICFSDPGGADAQAIAMRIVSSGQAWISTTQIRGRTVLRACISSYRTEPSDVHLLLDSLNAASSLEHSAAAHQPTVSS